jgi:DNA-directed RNA polymerase specialized sigma subunit
MKENTAVAPATPAAEKPGKADQKVFIVRPDNGTKPDAKPAQNPAIIVKPEAQAATYSEPKRPTPFATIAERLELMSDLDKLFTLRDDVEDALKSITDYKPSHTGGDTVIIRRQDGQSHSTSHPIVIAAMVDVAKDKLKARLEEIEQQIMSLF